MKRKIYLAIACVTLLAVIGTLIYKSQKGFAFEEKNRSILQLKHQDIPTPVDYVKAASQNQPQKVIQPQGSLPEIKDVPLPQPAVKKVSTNQTQTAPIVSNSGKVFVVVISEQHMYSYENGKVVNSFLVSTGKAATPSPRGTYRIYRKLALKTMSGPGYYLPNVPNVMYFIGSYAIHGTYWHNNFGTPMSRGCINLSKPDAAWAYGWAPIGTTVIIQ